MRRALLALLLAPALAVAEDPKPTEFKVQVGKSKVLTLDAPVTFGTCDDKSIVKVDGQTELTLTGLKVGKTLCGFWKTTDQPGFHTVYEVIVTKDDPDAAK